MRKLPSLIFVTACLFVVVITLTLWGWSCRRTIGYEWLNNQQSHAIQIAMVHGTVVISDMGGSDGSLTPSDYSSLTTADLDDSKLRIWSTVAKRFGSFGFYKGELVFVTNPFRAVMFPAWAVLVLALPVPAIVLLRHRRRRNRSRCGLCKACGYDLRGGHERRCPECGTYVS